MYVGKFKFQLIFSPSVSFKHDHNCPYVARQNQITAVDGLLWWQLSDSDSKHVGIHIMLLFPCCIRSKNSLS